MEAGPVGGYPHHCGIGIKGVANELLNGARCTPIEPGTDMAQGLGRDLYLTPVGRGLIHLATPSG